MLQPKRIKHKKVFRRKLGSVTKRGSYLAFGAYGLKSEQSNWVSARQIEAARRVIVRHIQRGGKLWIRVFPGTPHTAKSSEVGMGGGTGSIAGFVTPVEAGRILFELDGVSEQLARAAFNLAAHKLPVRVRFIKK